MAIIFGSLPDEEVSAAFEAGLVNVIRWLDIYQSDNVTLWQSQVPVTEGSVNVDMSRAERRNMDITIYDLENYLGYGPGKVWYDKVFKLYRGLVLPDQDIEGYISLPGVIGNAVTFARSALGSVTVAEWAVRVTLNAVGVAQGLAGWSGGGGGLALTSANKLNVGIAKTVSGTIGGADSSVAVPALAINTKVWLRGVVTVATAVCQYYWSDDDTNDYDAVTWTQVGTNVTGTNAAGAVDLTKTTTPIFGASTITVAGFAGKLYAGAEAISTAKTIEIDASDYPVDVATFVATTGQTATVATSGSYPNIARMVAKTIEAGNTWVTALGEFLADQIDLPRFPNTIHVNGRDFTKKLMLDKFSVTTTFATGANVAATIQTIATNAGITKFNFQVLTNTLGAEVTFEKNTPRWDACHQLATSISCDFYFDAFGYLTLKPMVDPITAPILYSFNDGAESNLADFSRSTSDSRLYNDVLVYGDSPDNPLVYAHVDNTTPSSPTRVAVLGRRTYAFASQFFTSNAQALAYAQKLLAVVALEQYEMNLSSIVLPWLEAGFAVEVLVSDAAVGDPTRFLLTSFTIPLALEAMSGTAKRITVVG